MKSKLLLLFCFFTVSVSAIEPGFHFQEGRSYSVTRTKKRFCTTLMTNSDFFFKDHETTRNCKFYIVGRDEEGNALARTYFSLEQKDGEPIYFPLQISISTHGIFVNVEGLDAVMDYLYPDNEVEGRAWARKTRHKLCLWHEIAALMPMGDIDLDKHDLNVQKVSPKGVSEGILTIDPETGIPAYLFLSGEREGTASLTRGGETLVEAPGRGLETITIEIKDLGLT